MSSYAMTRNQSPLSFAVVLVLIIRMFSAAVIAATGLASTPASLPPPCITPAGEICRFHTIVHDDWIRIEMRTPDGRKIGSVELLKVTITDAPEFARAGYGGGWIGQVSVAREYMGNGYGRMLWQQGDAVLRTQFPMEARALYDTAGWGPSLMAEVPASRVLWTDGVMWVYLP